MSKAYATAVKKLLDKRHLTRLEAQAVMGEIMDGVLEPSAIAALLTALAIKGETAEELAGFAETMRSRALGVRAGPEVLDTCGTGGSGLDKPNTSSLAALVLASDGVKVAKHGGRSNTGRTGSADVFEKLGVSLDLGPSAAEQLLDRVGIAFLFAPRFHPAMKHAAPVRKALGFRTTFNLLGPLANPARVRRQVLGVSDPDRAPLLAEALLALGAVRAMVVSADGGLDEISLSGATAVWVLDAGKIERRRIVPEDLGVARRQADHPGLTGPSTTAAAAAAFVTALEGKADPALLDLIALNAGAGFWVAGRVADLREGVARARAILAAGSAAATLSRFLSEAAALVGAPP